MILIYRSSNLFIYSAHRTICSDFSSQIYKINVTPDDATNGVISDNADNSNVIKRNGEYRFALVAPALGAILSFCTGAS